MTVTGFADELSTDSPAPGGGSVAALCGSLGAALAGMVANLTVGRKGQEDVWEEMIHVWHAYSRFVPEARRAIATIGEFLRSHWKT